MIISSDGKPLLTKYYAILIYVWMKYCCQFYNLLLIKPVTSVSQLHHEVSYIRWRNNVSWCPYKNHFVARPESRIHHARLVS